MQPISYKVGGSRRTRKTALIIPGEEKRRLVKIIFNEFCLPELSSDAKNKRISFAKIKRDGIIMTAVSLYRCQCVCQVPQEAKTQESDSRNGASMASFNKGHHLMR
jgi:hypothetical protein